MILLPSAQMSLSRRNLLIKTGTLSVACVAVLAGVNTRLLASEKNLSSTAQDIDVLNEILGTEYEGIAAYQIFADGGVFTKEILKVTSVFQGHHKEHGQVLVKTIRALGGVPAVAKTQNQYADDLNTSSIRTQNDALEFMLNLELGAANAYINMLPFTHNRELAKTAGRIAADETMHWTVLTTLLHEALPANAMSFGA